MKTKTLTLSALTAGFTLAAFTLIGCGGGGSTNSSIQTSKISGTVPGTLIEAFCADGSYYKVTSTDNNTTEHPFTIEIPSTVSCSLVMTTNENNETLKVITQIGVITPNGTGTLFTAAEDINLGNIALAMDPDGVDSDGDHVADEIFNIEVDGTLIKVELENNPLDDDGNGLVNIYEDDDGDGINNHDDDDDNDNGIPDSEELDNDNDLDGDGISNDVDVDDDNDGINDDVDSDDDNDGINDDDDSDDDNDGIDDNDDNDSEENDDNVVL